MHPAALLRRGGDFDEHILIIFQLFFGKAVVEGAFDVENVGRVFVFEIDEDAFVDGDAQPALFVQRVDRLVEHAAHFGDLFRLCGEIRILLRGGESERALQLFEQLRLVELAVQFETEIAQPYGVEPLFDDGERRLLFGDEQHAPAAFEAVGDDIGDGLALARARRAVQHEGGAGNSLGDGGKL